MKIFNGELFKLFLRDVAVLIFIRPVFVVFLNYIMFGSRYFSDLKVFFTITVVSIAVMVGSWRVHIVFDHLVRSKFSSANNAIKRLITSCCVHIPLSMFMLIATILIYNAIELCGFQLNKIILAQVLICGLCSNLASIGFQECVYFFYGWRENWRQAEELKKAHLISRFKGLKSQVNPHFLFNSINTLSSLIVKDQNDAEQFLSEMCKVYRYFLSGDKRDIVSLFEELAFIRSWFYLLSVRYGPAVVFEIDIDEEDLEKYVLPLAIHSIAEHAVAHNKIDKETPFIFRISSGPSDTIIVSSSINSRINMALPNASGDFEDHLKTRHRLLGLGQINIKKTSGFQSVEIPLIAMA